MASGEFRLTVSNRVRIRGGAVASMSDFMAESPAEARAFFPAERERSAKIRRQAHARRAVAHAGKEATGGQVP
jgi:hypothetical protein